MKTRTHTRQIDLYKPAMGWLASQKLSGEDYRVFFLMCSLLDDDNYIRVGQVKIAEELNTTQSSVSRAIKKLVELDVLVPAGRSGNKKSFIMNPQIAVKGEHDQQKLDNYLAAKAANEASKDNEPQADE